MRSSGFGARWGHPVWAVVVACVLPSVVTCAGKEVRSTNLAAAQSFALLAFSHEKPLGKRRGGAPGVFDGKSGEAVVRHATKGVKERLERVLGTRFPSFPTVAAAPGYKALRVWDTLLGEVSPPHLRPVNNEADSAAVGRVVAALGVDAGVILRASCSIVIAPSFTSDLFGAESSLDVVIVSRQGERLWDNTYTGMVEPRTFDNEVDGDFAGWLCAHATYAAIDEFSKDLADRGFHRPPPPDAEPATRTPPAAPPAPEPAEEPEPDTGPSRVLQ